jgi:hypothetical protein
VDARDAARMTDMFMSFILPVSVRSVRQVYGRCRIANVLVSWSVDLSFVAWSAEEQGQDVKVFRW